jgi:hypothetical protein
MIPNRSATEETNATSHPDVRDDDLSQRHRPGGRSFCFAKGALDAVPSGSRDISEVLGLELGVPVPSPDLLPTVFFAAMAGRTASFDEGSFERWQSQMEPGEPHAEFARQLVFHDLLPVESSPLEKVSPASLAARGPAYVVAASALWADQPVAALGIVVAGEFGAVVVGVIRGFGVSAATAAKYHTRRLFKVPPDWIPPEDR